MLPRQSAFLIAASAALALSPIGYAIGASVSGSNDDCKALYGFAIEGTATSDNEADYWFHQDVGRWAEAVSADAKEVTIETPSDHVTKLLGSNRDAIRHLEEKLKNLPADQVCKADKDFIDAFVGSGNYQATAKITQDAFIKYGDGPFNPDNYVPGEFHSGGATLNIVSKYDPTMRSITDKNAHLPFIDEIKERRSRCRAKADQVVEIMIADHGFAQRGKCEIALSNNRILKASDVWQNILVPLQKQGVKIILQMNSCFSGCFVDNLRAFLNDKNTCLMSTTRPSSVGEDRDDLVGGTYDATYPHFLKYLHDPLKAHFCAAAFDAYNEPQAYGGTKHRHKDDKVDNQQEQTPEDVFAAISKKLGDDHYKNLMSECQKARSRSDFPKGPLELDPAIAKKLFECKGVKALLHPSESYFEGFDRYVDGVRNPKSWPGLEGLKKMAASGDLEAMRNACDIDLTSYRPAGRDGAVTGQSNDGASQAKKVSE